jgi:rhamnosyltransferase subunit B
MMRNLSIEKTFGGVRIKGKRKIILSTIGSLGDIHPFIALGLALQARGFECHLAVPSTYRDKIKNTGLSADAIMSDFDEIQKKTGR